MSPASSTAISQTTNFLNDVFSQRAASDSPYDAQFQSVIRQHLLDLVGVSWPWFVSRKGPLSFNQLLVPLVANQRGTWQPSFKTRHIAARRQ